jgi:hypothetical protein
VVITPLEGGAPGYRYHYEAVRDGEVIAETVGTTECRMCTESELIEQVGAAVVRVAKGLPPTEKADATEAPKVQPEETTQPDTSATTDDRRRPLGVMGKVGIGLIVPGVAALAVGIGLAAKEPERKMDMPREAVTTRPPGIALAVVGTAVAITGVVLVAIDRKRARSSASARRPIVVPLASTDRFGLGLVGRF